MAVVSCQNYIKSLFVRDKVVVNTAYKEESILLLALYEKSFLRPDIVNLLKVAKKLGLYTIAVNTQKLSDTELIEKKKLIDTYVGIFNFGRDFGSYKKGFNYIFNKGFHKHAPRIVMLNDSVFYERSRLESFLKELIHTKKDVLGATQNFEVNYHIGSFCVSLAKSVTNHKRFVSYWRSFRRTDSRRVVIHRGEMGLSRVLSSIVSNPTSMDVIYNQQLVSQFLRDGRSEEKLNQWNSFLRTSSYVDWECNNFNSLLNEFVETHNVIFQQKSKEYKDEYIMRRETHIFNKAFTYIESLSDAKTLLMKYGDKDLYEVFLKFVAAKFIEQTRYGSQIHQNNACFVYMGLPIIKLDSIYRGMMNDVDVYKFKPLMDVAEYELLESLFFQKPFGDNIYFGWKKIAFQMGLI